MSPWRQVTRGLRGLFRPSTVDREIAEEVEHFLAEAAAEQAARGRSPEEARRAARVEVGSVTGLRDEVRAYGWENVVERTFADLRYAARRLRAEPVFTAVAALTLALGIGATTAIWSAVRPILFAPLPYPQASRIVMIWEVEKDGTRDQGTFGMLGELAAGSRSFEAMAAVKPWRPTLVGAGEPERFEGQRVSAAYFRVLGVSPVLGRSFDASEDRADGAAVVVLSDALWRRRFGADPAVVGRAITLDGSPHVVLGVMPGSFENVLAPSAELWAPLQYGLAQGRAWGHHLDLVGRLRPGVSPERASQELTALGRAVLAEQHPSTYGHDVELVASPLRDEVTRGVRPALLAILGAVVLVLVIACVNVTNLLLARGVRRRHELALRRALGAGQSRLLRQLLTESLLLAALGGALGMALAAAFVRALVALSPADLPRTGAIAVDGPVLAFGLALTTVVGLAFGLIPARQAARSAPQAALQQASPRAVGGHRSTRRALVVAEVALALVLLVGSGLLLRSLARLFAVAPGFDSSHLLTLEVQTTGPGYADETATKRFFAQALAAVRRLPGVAAAGLTSQLPLSGGADQYGVHFEPRPSEDPGEIRGSFRYAVAPGYFEAMRIPLVRGRLLDEHDRAGSPRVALVSESLARRRLPGLDPLGRQVRIGIDPLYTIVGVVGDVRQVSLAVADAEAVYTTEEQWRFADDAMTLVVRASGDPAALAPAVRQAVWSVDKDQPIVRLATMEGLLAASAAERRFALVLFVAFGLAALLLAAAGIYGVLAGSVAERTREIGVRSALGASRRAIVGLVVGEGMAMTGLGVAIGLAGAAATSRALAALLFGVSRLDPATYLGVVVLLAAVATLACAAPAWRAARVDPATTLRAE